MGIRERGRQQVVPAAETPLASYNEGDIISEKQEEEEDQTAGSGGSGGGGGSGGRWSWVLVDFKGRETILKVDKHEIMQRFGIHARDFHILDPRLSYPSAILVRDAFIILNLEHIKAIITADEVLIRDPSDEDVIPVVEELKRRIPDLLNSSQLQAATEAKDVGDDDIDESPFELRALEVTLEAVCSFLDARTIDLENAAYPALDDLTQKVNSRNLDQVRKLKSAMTRLTTRVQKVRDEIEQLLNDDDDMADLCLSRKLATPPLSSSFRSTTTTIKASKASMAGFHEENDVEELEMLLEAYFSQIEGTLSKLTTLREYIDDTEDYINIQIDNRRNQLIQLELFLNSGLLALSIYSLVTAIFGVNIPYTWNHNFGYIFKWVVIVAGLFSLLLFGVLMSYARFKGLVGS